MDRYVVMVRPRDDDHPNACWIYGVYQSKAKAEWFASKVNEKVEKADPYLDASLGWAWVKRVRKPVVVHARRLALHGEGAVA